MMDDEVNLYNCSENSSTRYKSMLSDTIRKINNYNFMKDKNNT